MVKKYVAIVAMVSFAFAGCTKVASNNSNAAGVSCSTYSGAVPSGNNVVPFSIGAGPGTTSICSQGGYVNEPCTSVTVCATNGTHCITVNDILVDTGSYGLRIYSSALGATAGALTQATIGSNDVAECAQFGTANEWGSVESARVTLGGESPVTIPIQVINSTFAGGPGSSPCTNPGSAPSDDGFNGILGVGVLAQDCGSVCVTNGAQAEMYYSCNGTNCSAVDYPLADQIVNPILSLPVDNNGVLVQIPAASSSGSPSTTGYLVFGVGTQANNTPSGTTTFPADPTFAVFNVNFNGGSYNQSFIDSGSNGLFFPSASSVPPCTDMTGFYCPSGTTGLSATDQGVNGSPSENVSFNVGNADTLVNSGNFVLNDLGGNSSDFDWGLPFFMGCNVYVGLEGQTSNALSATGPYWSF